MWKGRWKYSQGMLTMNRENLNKIEKELEMKEILYEEICSHYKDHVFTTTRGDYYISVDEKSARIEDEHTGEKISYS